MLFALPRSPSTQPSGFSLTLDLNDAAGDQSVSSIDLLPDQPVSVQIFASDIQNAQGISARFGYDPGQIAFDGFDPGEALPNAHANLQQDSTSFSVGVSSLSGSATVNTGLVGTVRLRTTAAFSDTEIWLVDAELARGGQTETISSAIGVALQVAAPPSPDFDGNGLVGFSDFVAFAGVFGAQRGDSKYVAEFDLNNDGGIGFDDFVICQQLRRRGQPRTRFRRHTAGDALGGREYGSRRAHREPRVGHGRRRRLSHVPPAWRARGQLYNRIGNGSASHKGGGSVRLRSQGRVFRHRARQ